MTKKMMILLIAIAALSPLLVMAAYVEDWSRDLTTNVAWTSADSDDPRLRPHATDQSAAAVIEAVMTFLRTSRSWSVAEEVSDLPSGSPLHDLTGDVFAEFHLVRTSDVLRWKDDVWVVLEERERQRFVHAHSRSRVGKGDLGQNPRNLRELLEALREE